MRKCFKNEKAEKERGTEKAQPRLLVIVLSQEEILNPTVFSEADLEVRQTSA